MMLFEIHLVSGKSLDLFPYIISADMGLQAVLCFTGQGRAGFSTHLQGLVFQFRAYKSRARMSGRLGGGPWKGIRIN